MDLKEVTELVESNLRETLIERGELDPAKIGLNKLTELLGKKAVLDSVGLVSLIVNIEQKLSENYGIDVTLADERAMSQKSSPFKTVETLSRYIFDSFLKGDIRTNE